MHMAALVGIAAIGLQHQVRAILGAVSQEMPVASGSKIPVRVGYGLAQSPVR